MLLPFLVLTFLYNLAMPVFEAGDEQVHFLYVRHLATGRGLPVQSPQPFSSYAAQHSSYPPLYYLLVAALTFWVDTDDVREDIQDIFARPGSSVVRVPGRPMLRGPLAMFSHDPTGETFPFRGVALAVHLGRLVSSALGAVTVYVVYRAGRSLWPEPSPIPLGAAGLLAFNPQFIYMSAALNNDNLVTALSTVALLLALRIVSGQGGTGAWWMLGLVVALATLTKQSSLSLFGLAAAAWLLMPHHRGVVHSLSRLAPVVVLPPLLGSWWLARNWRLYGDPLGWRVFLAAAGRLVRPAEMTLSAWERYLAVVATSYWLAFGWLNVWAPTWFYATIAGLCAASSIGWTIAVAWLRPSWLTCNVRGFALLAVWCLTMASLLVWWIVTTPSATQGRLLFPAAGAVALILAGGLYGAWPGRMAGGVVASVSIGLLGADLWALWFVLGPAYAV